MAQLAIKGHPTRGKEVIQLLEMLGGKSNSNMNGYNDDLYYFIAKDGVIYGSDKEYEELACNYSLFTLEEFEEKYPYKVGDKVYNIIHNENQTITEVAWDFQEDEIVYQINNNDYLFVNYLQPYKEETIEESIDKTNKVIFETNAQCCDIRNEIIKKDIKQTLKDKLKDCDKEVLIDIIAEVCNVYVGARIFSDMSSANCIQQCVNSIQTNFQEVDNFIAQRINANFRKL